MNWFKRIRRGIKEESKGQETVEEFVSWGVKKKERRVEQMAVFQKL